MIQILILRANQVTSALKTQQLIKGYSLYNCLVNLHKTKYKEHLNRKEIELPKNIHIRKSCFQVYIYMHQRIFKRSAKMCINFFVLNELLLFCTEHQDLTQNLISIISKYIIEIISYKDKIQNGWHIKNVKKMF